MQLPNSQPLVVVLDLDDTLWKTGHKYLDSRKAMAGLIAGMSGQDADVVEKTFLSIDKGMHDFRGPAHMRWFESALMTYAFFMRDSTTRVPASDMAELKKHADIVWDKPELYPDTVPVLNMLKRKNVTMYAFTMGDWEGQGRKIDALRLSGEFDIWNYVDDMEAVHDKSMETHKAFLGKLSERHPGAHIVYIGDSIFRDANPAAMAGYDQVGTIYGRAPQHPHAEVASLDSRVILGESLEDMVRKLVPNIDSYHYHVPEVAKKPSRVDIVMVSGYRGCGKDTFCDYLGEYGFKRVSFADPLREISARVHDVPVDWFVDRDKKEKPPHRIMPCYKYEGEPRTLRQLLIDDGDTLRWVLGSDVFVREAARRIANDVCDKGLTKFCISNYRVTDEHYLGDMVRRELGARALWDCAVVRTTVRIERGDMEALRESIKDAHETDKAFLDFRVNVVVQNNGTLVDLHESAERLALETVPRKEEGVD